MTSTKEAEDNNLPVSASHEIDIMKYVSYRRNEIELLTSESFLSKGAVKGKKPNKSQFQLLPRHMRRRTMGFIRKRLPHRIRQTAVIKPPSKVNKRPSRKYRRKPRKLLSEYERRKRAVMWLETHIWHAKRFHMSKSLFGYRLALFDNCKAKRAVFRALKSGCCLHDESYYVCHELTGRQEDLIAGLNRLCSPRLGLTFAAKMLTSGQFEGRVILYEADRYPFGCIGPCRFIWKPEDKENSSGERKLWLWSHPSVYLDVQKQLIDVWNMTLIEEEPSTKEDDSSPKNKKIKLENDALISIATKFKSNKVQLECLKDNLIRFKLLGPLSTTILANVLKTFDSENMNSLELSLYEKQINLWNKMKLMIKDPNEVVCSSVLGLLVKDPRLAMPKKKSFNQINEQNQKIDARKSQLIKQEVNEEIRKSVLSRSQIWDKNVIEELNSKKKSTHEINKLRQGFLIPGTELTQVETHSHIPVILIQNSTLASTSGSVGASIRNGSLSSGWDLILPKTWAMSFWMCLVHFGARAIAQAELNYLTFESGNLQFPNEYIDTKSSENELNKSKLDLYAKHSRRPASKRVNFIRQHFLTPFYHPIRGILSLNLGLDHLTPKHFILRDKFILSKIQTAYFTRRVAEIDLIDRQHLNHSYIAVRLQCDNRGTLDNFSILYQHNETTDQNETEKDDSKLVMRSILDEHKKECIKKLTSDEKNKSKDKKITLNKLIRANSNPNELLLDESVFLKFQRELSDSKSFRRPIGFVINGAFNLACGKCTANGFVLTKSILESIEQKKQQPKQQNTNFVLFKTPTCDIYKTARITNIFI